MILEEMANKSSNGLEQEAGKVLFPKRQASPDLQFFKSFNGPPAQGWGVGPLAWLIWFCSPRIPWFVSRG